MRPKDVPAHAERFSLFDFSKLTATPSRYVPGVSAQTLKIVCPSCRQLHDHVASGHRIACCGLTLQIEIDALWVWPAAEPIKSVA